MKYFFVTTFLIVAAPLVLGQKKLLPIQAEKKPAPQKTEAQHKLGDVTVRGRTQSPRLKSIPEIAVARPDLPVEMPKDFNDVLTTQIDAIPSE